MSLDQASGWAQGTRRDAGPAGPGGAPQEDILPEPSSLSAIHSTGKPFSFIFKNKLSQLNYLELSSTPFHNVAAALFTTGCLYFDGF